MSDTQNTPLPVTDAAEHTSSAHHHHHHQPESMAVGEAVEEPRSEVSGVQEPVAAVSGDGTDETKSAVEPVTEGVLGYKGPGLLKSLMPSKKEFWLSDAPVSPQHLELYMRGEKAEHSHPVVAWASVTGKGLLFFNKKGETERTRPQGVLPLYEATDLRKSSPSDLTLDILGTKHTLKAANDAERDGWYASIERAMEMGKADKEVVRTSETYVAEIERLNKPSAMAGSVVGAGAASHSRSKSRPKKSADIEPRRANSDADEELDGKKHKNRSTSRSVLNRLKGKKEEMEVKREEKKEEKEEVKAEKEAEKHGDAAPLVGGPVLDAPSTAERVIAAPLVDGAEPAAAASAPTTTDGTTKSEERAMRPNKRASIFGRMGSGWGSMKSPAKEREMKDAELKPEVPAKDVNVAETAPQIPEPSMEDATGAPTLSTTEPAEEGKPAEAAKEQLDTVSPNTQQKGFLSGLPFLNKRNRSVSPSANMKETPARTEEPATALPARDESAIEPTTATTSTTEEPLEASSAITDEPVRADAVSPSANKRQSMLGNIGRRASKAFKGMQAPRKENVAPTATPATDAKASEEATETTPATAEKALNGERLGSSEPSSHPHNNLASSDAMPASEARQSTPTVTASA